MTNKSRITKCMTFGLVPVPETEERLADLLKIDEEYRALAEELRPAYIEFAKKNICDICSDLAGENWDDLFVAYANKNQTKIDAFRKNISKAFLKNHIDMNTVPFQKDILPAFLKETDVFTEDEKSRFLEINELMKGKLPLMRMTCQNTETSIDIKCPERIMENFELYISNMPLIKVFFEFAHENGIEIPEEMLAFEAYTLSSSYPVKPADITEYNRYISGLYNDKGECIVPGFNVLVNLTNQKNASNPDYHGAFFRKVKPLYKQILMPAEKSFRFGSLQNDDEAREVVRELTDTFCKKNLNKYKDLLRDKADGRLVISGRKLHSFSEAVCESHSSIPELIMQSMAKRTEIEMAKAKKASDRKRYEKMLEMLPAKMAEQNYSLNDIEDICALKTLDAYRALISSLIDTVLFNRDAVIADNTLNEGVTIFANNTRRQSVIALAESIVELRQALTLITGAEDESENLEFYSEFSLDIFENLKHNYNLLHSYLTKTPADLVKKYETVFGTTGKYDGAWWDGQPLSRCDHLLGSKDGKHYFLTAAPGKGTIDIVECDPDEPHYDMLKQTKAGAKMYMTLPRYAFNLKSFKAAMSADPDWKEIVLEEGFSEPVTITRAQYDVYQSKKFTTTFRDASPDNASEFKAALAMLIDLYKVILLKHQAFSNFTFEFRPTESYTDLSDFCSEMDTFCLHMEIVPVSAECIDKLVSSGELLMFTCSTRDLRKENYRSPYSRTFLEIFSASNLENPNIQLNSKPSIFYRPATISEEDAKPTHVKGSVLVNKRLADEEHTKIPNDLYIEIYKYLNHKSASKSLSPEAKKILPFVTTKTASRDIYRDRRYMRDMFMLTFSITKNIRVSEAKKNDINDKVSAVASDVPVLTVTRGRSYLIYLSVFSPDGKILEQQDLTVINGINYAQLFMRISSQRKEELRKEWSSDTVIADQKKAYLSLAIATIVATAVKYGAIIVIEKYNDTFKNTTNAMDANVFKLFGTMLKARLSDLHFRSVEKGAPGSAPAPLQLIMGEAYTGSQNGILYELNDAYTKNMDPTSGFCSLFDFNSVKSVGSIRNFLKKFDEIRFVPEEHAMLFSFDYNNLPSKKISGKTDWTVRVQGEQTVFNKYASGYDLIEDRTAETVAILREAGIDPEQNIAEQLDDAKGATLKSLLKMFQDAIYGTVIKKCEGNSLESYVSPINGRKSFSPAQAAGRMLYEKFLFHITHRNVENYTDEWVNYYQSKF